MRGIHATRIFNGTEGIRVSINLQSRLNEAGGSPRFIVAMSNPAPANPVESLFPFALKARALIVGRDALGRSKGRLHFVLITTDISENSRRQILKDFTHYPVVQHYTGADFEKFFGLKGAKVVGFAKSGLAQSIYAGLKEYRINQPLHPARRTEVPGESPVRIV